MAEVFSTLDESDPQYRQQAPVLSLAQDIADGRVQAARQLMAYSAVQERVSKIVEVDAQKAVEAQMIDLFLKTDDLESQLSIPRQSSNPKPSDPAVAPQKSVPTSRMLLWGHFGLLNSTQLCANLCSALCS